MTINIKNMDFKDLHVGDCAYYVTTELIYKCKIISMTLKNDTELEVTYRDPWNTRHAENVDKTNNCQLVGSMVYSDKDEAIKKQRELRYKELEYANTRVTETTRYYNELVKKYTSTTHTIKED